MNIRELQEKINNLNNTVNLKMRIPGYLVCCHSDYSYSVWSRKKNFKLDMSFKFKGDVLSIVTKGNYSIKTARRILKILKVKLSKDFTIN